MDRRRYLHGLVSVTAVTLAGCSGGPDETPTESPTNAQAPGGDTATEPVDDATPTPTPTTTDSPTPTPTPLPPVDAEVAGGPDGDFRFAPEQVTIAAGETVRWLWEAGGHNVKPESIPADADWSGTPGEQLDTFDAGYVYAHTFEVTGRYDYICGPHQSVGMTGRITVE